MADITTANADTNTDPQNILILSILKRRKKDKRVFGVVGAAKRKNSRPN